MDGAGKLLTQVLIDHPYLWPLYAFGLWVFIIKPMFFSSDTRQTHAAPDVALSAKPNNSWPVWVDANPSLVQSVALLQERGYQVKPDGSRLAITPPGGGWPSYAYSVDAFKYWLKVEHIDQDADGSSRNVS